MADRLTPEARSRLMATIRGKDTGPELAVRRLLHSMGYRFRLHRRDLPGTPDIVLPSRRKAIFVHGCFWHGHPRCRFATRPATRPEFWAEKIARNKRRDRIAAARLRRLGWSVMIVWECGLRSAEDLRARLQRFLDGGQ
ncbi:MAG: DNA mismatch endonuclease Vsr [Elioraea sp.]|nr:DNA mismatch endonuclease Vsr [Elioraea sp.]